LKKFSKKTKKELIEKKISIIKNSQHEYPITLQLIKDGKKNKILNKRIKSQIKVTMIHGKKDDVVPVSFSKKVLSIFTKAKKKLVLIRNGNHSLSDKKSLKKILEELDKIVSNII
jgi:esterase/lipase